jgi:beta-carotene 3-hydroxylase
VIGSWSFWWPAIAAFAAMELWSLAVHRWLWHGPLWWGHHSHHRRSASRLQRNDAFALVHAGVAAPLIIFGLGAADAAMVGAGAGMTAFGACYALIHDGLVHRRLPVGWLGRARWLRQIRNAHLAHHARDAVTAATPAAPHSHQPPYGLLLGPLELRLAQRRRASERRGGVRRVRARQTVAQAHRQGEPGAVVELHS